MYLLDSDDVDIICGAFFILPGILQKQGNVMQRDWLSSLSADELIRFPDSFYVFQGSLLAKMESVAC